MTRSMNYTDGPQILGATAQNLFAREIWRPSYVNLWPRRVLRSGIEGRFEKNVVTCGDFCFWLREFYLQSRELYEFVVL